MKKVIFVVLVLLSLPVSSFAVTTAFNQISWLDNNGGYTSQNSDWGQAVFQFSSADAGMFSTNTDGLYGYLNVVTTVAGGGTNNWAVQNSLLCFENASRIDDSFAAAYAFDLGIAPGTSVSSLDYYYTLSSAPLGSAPAGTAGGTSVIPEEWLFGGLDSTDDPLDPDQFSGNTGQAEPPDAQNYVGAAVGSAAGGAGQVPGNTGDVPAIDEDKNGCAPGACARSLKYLQNKGGPTIPGSAQDLYNKLKGPDYLNTSIGKDGTGTKISQIYIGKTKFAIKEKVPVDTKKTKDPDELVKKLKKGADVEIGVYWGKNAKGESMGGHCAMVTDATVSRDGNGNVTGYEVSIVDDGKQGDGNASNTPHKLSFDKDGNLKGYGTGAKLYWFWVETPVAEPSSLGLMGAVLLMVRRRRS